VEPARLRCRHSSTADPAPDVRLSEPSDRRGEVGTLCELPYALPADAQTPGDLAACDEVLRLLTFPSHFVLLKLDARQDTTDLTRVKMYSSPTRPKPRTRRLGAGREVALVGAPLPTWRRSLRRGGRPVTAHYGPKRSAPPSPTPAERPNPLLSRAELREHWPRPCRRLYAPVEVDIGRRARSVPRLSAVGRQGLDRLGERQGRSPAMIENVLFGTKRLTVRFQSVHFACTNSDF